MPNYIPALYCIPDDVHELFGANLWHNSHYYGNELIRLQDKSLTRVRSAITKRCSALMIILNQRYLFIPQWIRRISWLVVMKEETWDSFLVPCSRGLSISVDCLLHRQSQLAKQNLPWQSSFCQLPASCKLQVASCKLQVANYKLQVASCKLQVASCNFQVARQIYIYDPHCAYCCWIFAFSLYCF